MPIVDTVFRANPLAATPAAKRWRRVSTRKPLLMLEPDPRASAAARRRILALPVQDGLTLQAAATKLRLCMSGHGPKLNQNDFARLSCELIDRYGVYVQTPERPNVLAHIIDPATLLARVPQLQRYAKVIESGMPLY